MLNKNSTTVPKHLSVVLDGNGRWASNLGKPRFFGHRKGVEKVEELIDWSLEKKIEYLTLFVFSKENWKRSGTEVGYLFDLVEEACDRIYQKDVRLFIIGDRDGIRASVLKKLDDLVLKTANNKGITTTLAINYSGKWDVLNAVKQIVYKIKEGTLTDLNESVIDSFLSTGLLQIPNPDLCIRTGGELRLSNFMLWQHSYTEFFFTKTFWPDFSKQEFEDVLLNYSCRERRFGGI